MRRIGSIFQRSHDRDEGVLIGEVVLMLEDARGAGVIARVQAEIARAVEIGSEHRLVLSRWHDPEQAAPKQAQVVSAQPGRAWMTGKAKPALAPGAGKPDGTHNGRAVADPRGQMVEEWNCRYSPGQAVWVRLASGHKARDETASEAHLAAGTPSIELKNRGLWQLIAISPRESARRRQKEAVNG